MAYIRRYTSPTQELVVENIDLTQSDVYVTYKQGRTILNLSGEDIEMETEVVDDQTNTVISVYMSQETTAAFKTNDDIEVQVNWLTDGERNATVIAKVGVYRNLLEEVIRE